jgi:tetraacyldisaccharide-1-P 4'-kinase
MENQIMYYCDNARHLVCKPYSLDNLHKMATNLNIKRCWFHKDHYDIPLRRIEEITLKYNLVSSKDIVKIIKFDDNKWSY